MDQVENVDKFESLVQDHLYILDQEIEEEADQLINDEQI